MGIKEWWDSFIGTSIEEPEETPTEEKKVPTTFVTTEELEDYENSKYGQIDVMRAKLEAIIEVMPTDGIKLLTRLDAFQRKLDELDEIDDPDPLETEVQFQTLKAEVEQLHKVVEGRYKINELKKQNNNMHIRFKKPIESTYGLEQEIEEFEDYISKIQTTIDEQEAAGTPVLHGNQREVFNRESLIAEYRLNMLKLLLQVARSPMRRLEFNPFENLPKTKQIMFASLLLEDAKELGDDFDNVLKKPHDIINRYYDGPGISALDGTARELDNLLSDSYVVKTFSPQEVFDSNSTEVDSAEFLRKMVALRYHTSQITWRMPNFIEREAERVQEEAERAKREEEEAKRREEERIEREAQEAAKKAKKAEEEEKARLAEEERLNKYKKITNEEIEAEIRRIANDLSSTGSRYVNILDFQKMVAREKGLLTTEERMAAEGLAYIPAKISDLYSMIKLANSEGVSYTVFPSSQEFDDEKKYLFIVSETDKSKVTSIGTKPFSSSYTTGYGIEPLGEVTVPVMWMMHKRLKEKLEDENDRMKSLIPEIGYETTNKSGRFELKYGITWDDESTDYENKKRKMVKETVKEVYEELKTNKLDTKGMLKDVKCYLSVPAQRNIMPILEAMQAAGIEVFMEPEPKSKSSRNQKHRDNIHIYFDRDDLAKYKLDVEPKVSTPAAPVTIGGERLDFATKMIDDCDWEKAGIKKGKDK